MRYEMTKQLRRGEAAERLLDQHFTDRFSITPATRDQQREGIDRIFVARDTSKEYTVEYKTDWTAGRTNNAFIETISVDTMDVPGWAYTSQADWLAYYVPDKQQVYLARFAELRTHLDEWIETYGPAKAIPNDGYYTWGVPVPLSAFEICCAKVEQIAVAEVTPLETAAEPPTETTGTPGVSGFVESPFGATLGAFAGIPSFMRQPVSRDLDSVDVAVLGIPYDGGAASWRSGTRMGPRHIRAASAIMWGHHAVADISPLQQLTLVDYGDVAVDPTSIERTYPALEQAAATIIDAGTKVLALGGDHSVSLPLLRAHAARYGPLALIHVDAHHDTSRRTGFDHGTPFLRAIEEGLIDVDAYIQLGIRGPTYSGDRQAARALGMTILTIDDCFEMGIPAIVEKIQQVVGTRQTYLTFDIDSVDPAYAPGTGTPEVGGFTSYQILQLLRGLRGIDLVGMDLVEVSPPYDHGEITSILAANVAFEFLTLLALA